MRLPHDPDALKQAPESSLVHSLEKPAGGAELAALVVQLQANVERLTKRIDDLENENVGLKSRIVELEAENAELWKKNPMQRLDKSYSMTAEEKQRQLAEQKKAGATKKHGSHGDKQSSERPGRKPNQDKID